MENLMYIGASDHCIANVHFYASTAKKKYMVSMYNLPLTNFDFIIIQSIALTTSSTLKFQRWPC